MREVKPRRDVPPGVKERATGRLVPLSSVSPELTRRAVAHEALHWFYMQPIAVGGTMAENHASMTRASEHPRLDDTGPRTCP